MKITVNYYDIETDQIQTKRCFQFNNTGSDFVFIPVDDPVTIYKSIVIKDVDISIWHDDDRKMNLKIHGWQYTKNGYAKTTTTVFIKDDED